MSCDIINFRFCHIMKDPRTYYLANGLPSQVVLFVSREDLLTCIYLYNDNFSENMSNHLQYTVNDSFCYRTAKFPRLTRLEAVNYLHVSR